MKDEPETDGKCRVVVFDIKENEPNAAEPWEDKVHEFAACFEGEETLEDVMDALNEEFDFLPPPVRVGPLGEEWEGCSQKLVLWREDVPTPQGQGHAFDPRAQKRSLKALKEQFEWLKEGEILLRHKYFNCPTS